MYVNFNDAIMKCHFRNVQSTIQQIEKSFERFTKRIIDGKIFEWKKNKVPEEKPTCMKNDFA